METIRLNTSTSFTNHDVSKQLIEKFHESCLHLDASIFEPFMKEEDIFEDKEKYLFLARLREIFDLARFNAGPNFSVELSNAKCLGCKAGQPVSRFNVYANKTLVYDFGFLITMENGILKDIYQCNLYKEREGHWLKPKGLPEIYLEF